MNRTVETIIRRSDIDEIAPMEVIEGLALTPPQGTVTTIDYVQYVTTAAPEVSITHDPGGYGHEPIERISVYLLVASVKEA